MNEKTLLVTIIALIKSAMSGKAFADIKIDDFKLLYDISVMHNIFNLVYEGLYINRIEIPEEYKKAYINTATLMVMQSEQQTFSGRKISESFNNALIKHMPMKGFIIKSLYPRPEFRRMSDIDILIDYEQCELIKSVMQDLGYIEHIQSDHEWIWNKKPDMHIELHKRLIPSYDDDLYSYYKNAWNFGKSKKDNTYAMSDEDFYVYMFTHYAKHYRYGGIGILHVLDIWVLRTKCTEIDYHYINKQVKKLGLWEFYNNTLKLISAWFEDGEKDEVTELMSAFIFESGAYGTAVNHQVSDAVKKVSSNNDIKKTRRLLYINRIFLSYDRMCRLYPILEKMPIILPFCHIHRILKALIFRTDELKVIKENLENTTEEKILEHKRNLEKVGLKYNNKSRKKGY